MTDQSVAEQEYVLGTNDDELVRLGYQHEVWGELARGAWERAGFSRGQSILDVGCGPGYATTDLAHLVGPDGHVTAVDVSARFVEHLKIKAIALGLKQIHAQVMDVQALDLQPGSIDAAYARWVLCFVPRPEDVVSGIARALRPGGVIAIQDYSRYLTLCLAPRSSIFEKVVQAVCDSWCQNGGDPDICLRVPSMLADEGLVIEQVRPIVRIARPGSSLWNWPVTFFENFLPVLESTEHLTAEDCREFQRELTRYSDDPNALFITPQMMEIIARKPEQEE